jgi:putative SOS response-associated peptidase YedK
MCNLYTVRLSAAEVAAHFRVPNPMQSNAPEEVYPGTPGMVVTENEGVRELARWCGAFPCV